MKWGVPNVTFIDASSGRPVRAAVFGTLDPVLPEHEEAWRGWLASSVASIMASTRCDAAAIAARPSDLTQVLGRALGPTLAAQLGAGAAIMVVGVQVDQGSLAALGRR